MKKPPLLVSSMWGIGDNIHSRAVLRELIKINEVWLETSNTAIYHDLDVKLVPQTKPSRIRQATISNIIAQKPPADALRKKISYDSRLVVNTGSVLAAQFASCGVAVPALPDFRMPIPPSWRERMRRTVPLPGNGKPLLVYRPIIQNEVWRCPLRSPGALTYDALFESISDRFFTISVADLSASEWIVGPEPLVDIKLHHGELDFETMAALFAEARMTFVNPGFAPALSQAVGTPTMIVYGGYECFATTHAYGARLTPTLAIDTDAPCRCFAPNCQNHCSKKISLTPALDRIEAFVDANIEAAC